MKFISKILSFLILISCLTIAYTQESITYKNERYFVYPHKKKSHMSWEFVNAVDMKNEKNKDILLQELYNLKEVPLEDLELTKADYERELKESFTAKLSKKQKAYIRQNSDKYYVTYYGKNQGLIPSLDPLPDGKYAQLFEGYYLMDKSGNLRPDNSKIAGFFNIKNGLIDGFAYWINELGDTIEKGNFLNGQRTGFWEFISINNFNIKEEKISLPNKQNKIACNYKEGMLNGIYEQYHEAELISKGEYKDDKASGEWFDYEYDSDSSRYYLYKHYTYSDKNENLISKKPMIRKLLYDVNEVLADTFEIPFLDYNFPYYMTELFAYNFVEQEDYELPEEKYGSYDGASASGMEEEYYDESEFDYGNENGTEKIFHEGKFYEPNKLLDSIGIKFKYKDVFETFWPNGKIQFRYKFADGELLAEDTAFWDNGKPANIISFNPEKKRYFSTDYDLKGRIMRNEEYDSIGRFVSKFEAVAAKTEMIDGLPATVNEFGYLNNMKYYNYDNSDTLDTLLVNPATIFKSWYRDKTACGHVLFEPQTRELKIDVNSMNGFKKIETVFTFGEQYSYYSCKSIQRYTDLTMETISNGNLKEGYIPDSVPQHHVKNLYNLFTGTNDYTLRYKNIPFTGDFSMSFDQSKQRFIFSDKSIKLVLGGKKIRAQVLKDIENYYKKKRIKHKELLDILDIGMQYDANFISFFPQIQTLLNNRGSLFDTDETFFDSDKIEEVKGRFENGKPVGKWVTLDKSGKIRCELLFESGEINGAVKYYSYALPKNLNLNKENEALFDLPNQKTYYLSSIRHYNKGILNGEEKHFDWQGNVIYSASYKDGYLDGTTREQNKIFTTQTSYEDGLYDGIMQTKLSLPGKDTILLYDINFQNNQLQGESRSYHSNGKLAKKGFFLNNEPIEDYEAYDSLGTKYHYVKFLYSFPVEEKIWEENELSVKYEYDWRDSIFFRPSDLIDIPSVYDLLYQYNLIDDSYYDAPYFGRPSLIDKTGITYQVSKFYPNEILAREGTVKKGKKTGCWRYYDIEGKKLYEIDYNDSILIVNDSIKFKSKGIYYDYNTPDGSLASSSYVIEKIENYDCSHTDHYENRQFYTIWMASDSKQDRMNGYVKNYYDNGTLQGEGNMKNGLPSGVWKYYTPNGMLNQVGMYVMGKRHGRWLSGDLSKTNYLGDICMNPNAPDVEERIRYQENILDIQIRYFKLGKIQKTEVFDLNLNK